MPRKIRIGACVECGLARPLRRKRTCSECLAKARRISRTAQEYRSGQWQIIGTLRDGRELIIEGRNTKERAEQAAEQFRTHLEGYRDIRISLLKK